MHDQHPIEPYVLAERLCTVLRGWRDPATLPSLPTVSDDARGLWQRFETLSALHESEAAARIAETEFLAEHLTRAEQRGAASVTGDSTIATLDAD